MAKNRKLGMATTAEGVETEEQISQLRQVGCTEVQGFLFDHPRPAADIRHWLAPGVDWMREARGPKGTINLRIYQEMDGQQAL